MKKDIHPTYYPNATIRCSCGNVIKTGATKPEMAVEICSACHPFYTGKEKIIDTAGRVEKFRKRLAKKSSFASTSAKASADKKASKDKQKTKKKK